MSTQSDTTDRADQDRARHAAVAIQVLAIERDNMRALSPAPDLFQLLCSDHARLMRGDSDI